MEEQIKKETKKAWSFAADAARITDEAASSEDRKHTSEGVFVAIDSDLGLVIRRSCHVHPRERRKGCPSMGDMSEEVSGFLPCISGTQKVGHRQMKP